MGHRHLQNGPQIPETDGDQGWNHMNQCYNHMGMAGAFGTSSLVHPVENMTAQGGIFPSSVPISSGNFSSIPNVEPASYQPEAPFPHHSAANNYLHHPSSSNLSGQNVQRLDELFHNQTMGSGSHKRKTPCTPHLSDKGSTSRFHDVGSSSSLHLPTDTWQMYPPPGFTANSLAVSGEYMPRNVRSGAGVNPELNTVRTSQPSYQPDSVGFWGQSSNTLTHQGNQCLLPWPAGHGVNPGAVNRHPNGSVGSGIVSHNATANRNLVPQNASCNGIPNQPIADFRAQSSNFQRQATASTERLQLAAQRQRSRQPHVFSAAPVTLHRSEIFGSGNPFDDRHRDMRLDVDNMSYEELLVLGERIGSVGTGLSDSLISKCLTESIFCAPDQCEDDDPRCVICLEEYKHMDDVGNLKCQHDFHVACIRKWLSIKNLCPICKSSAAE